MNRQAAYNLLKCFLEKRGIEGIDLKKELNDLLAYGELRGIFTDPNTVFEEEEWRKLGDKLFDAVINEEKAAKKLMKPWRAVTNTLTMHKAEQRVAAAAAERLSSTAPTGGTPVQPTAPAAPDCPLPPSVRSIVIPQSSRDAWDLSRLSSTLESEGKESPPTDQAAQGAMSIDPSTDTCGAIGPGPDATATPVRSRGDSSCSSQGAAGIASERQQCWQKIAEAALNEGDREAAARLLDEVGAFPVLYQPDARGRLVASIQNLDWKLLSQLRATVNESGVKGEPTQQMLDYIWGTNILLPGDIRSIMKLILTQHQLLLFNAHWQAACMRSVATVRQPGDPLYGITVDELMGFGPYLHLEAQAVTGPDKAKEAMLLARQAFSQLKEPGGIPSYIGIKQGREEAFGLFIDRVANAIQAAGVPEYLRGSILKQCAIQNSNLTTRNILATLPGTFSIEEALERMAQVPMGPQAMLVEAVKELGKTLQEHTQTSHSQIMAALAPLQTPTARPMSRGPSRLRCFRCGSITARLAEPRHDT
ncbi:uncharacterized protein LOC142049850 isoform X1 [Phalacrocorax aristotelis]|uniref:uncharacterized protein LOC142049850 isoform X1 n=1 Tax=Phalacrocorax aristotelis TaxID=126867 RepID=UPI003F4BAB30